jgi:hypothetical protein
MTLISRVDIRPDRVEINIRRDRLVELLGAHSTDLPCNEASPTMKRRTF